jgi:hypothetical protein
MFLLVVGKEAMHVKGGRKSGKIQIGKLGFMFITIPKFEFYKLFPKIKIDYTQMTSKQHTTTIQTLFSLI